MCAADEEKVSKKSEENPWFNADINFAKRRLRKAEQILYKNNNDITKAEFRKLRQEKCQLVEQAKIKCYTDKISDCRSDHTKFQKLLIACLERI